MSILQGFEKGSSTSARRFAAGWLTAIFYRNKHSISLFLRLPWRERSRLPESQALNLPGTRVATGADALVESMLAHGIDTLFALPGAQIDHLFASLHDRSDRIRTIVSRQEQGAGYMAFGAARSTGKPSAYAVVPGPGWLNSASSLLTAYSCYAPVMSIAGQIPSASIGRDLGELHEVPDQLGLAAGLTKRAERIDSAESASLEFARAYRSMLSETPRPVYLEMPPDIMGAPADGALTPPLARPAGDLPPDDDIERAARLLLAADEPLIFVVAAPRAVPVP